MTCEKSSAQPCARLLQHSGNILAVHEAEPRDGVPKILPDRRYAQTLRRGHERNELGADCEDEKLLLQGAAERRPEQPDKHNDMPLLPLDAEPPCCRMPDGFSRSFARSAGKN